MIVLIDEYDVPLAKAFEHGYYDQMVILLRNLFEQVLKTNDSLQFAVLMGCMRISKESIFTGLNNLRALSIADVINYCVSLRADENARPQYYWSNTSSNDAVRKFIDHAEKGTTKREIEKLIAGEVITKEIHQDLTYKDMYRSIDNIWSLLFMIGYLTQRGRADGNVFQLAIPNIEIRNIFTTQIMECFKENVEKDGVALNAFCDELLRDEEMTHILK